jgi:NhaA family Na+:H+ antiporter
MQKPGKNTYAGLLLLLSAVLSLILANLLPGYAAWWAIFLPGFHTARLPHNILDLINDGLMAVFFFLAGLEIKKELLQGELSSFKKALMPVAAAAGGMAVPALLFVCFNSNNAYHTGWAIPVATDIAFALGVGALCGRKFTPAMKIFLTALAIIDDLGGILIIALFYGGRLQGYWLLAGLAIVALLAVLSFRKVSRSGPYLLLGLLLWYCVFNSGLHPTLAGVVTALFLPVTRLKPLEKQLSVPVNFGIVPLFALANTAIVLPPHLAPFLYSPLTYGIAAGLLIGKPLGILLTTSVLNKLQVASFPAGITYRHLLGIGLLAGIGFTMSLFLSVLSFEQADYQENAKLAVLAASLLAMGVAWVYIRRMKPVRQQP